MITVLRLGHRPFRDKRITTHVALVARAFGADQILIDTKDESIEENMNSISKRFGGEFIVKTGVKPLAIVKKWQGIIVHLTMYGATLSTAIEDLQKKKEKDLLLIVGADKVPPQYYEHADWNVSIGNQPHSEVAAVALFLDRYLQSSWETKKLQGAMYIIPSRHGKQVVTKKQGDEP